MRVVNQKWEWAQKPIMALETIEMAGRTCYKSEKKITPESAEKFVRMILKCGHESVIEHMSASVRFITNRGVTHELVRHRLCAFSQESTRYVNYSGSEIEYIRPVWLPELPLGVYHVCDTENLSHPANYWIMSMLESERSYYNMISHDWRPELAREVLPNSLKTEIVVTANLREWRHIFKLRTSPAAHPQMRDLMRSCLSGFKEAVPVLFDDINIEQK